MTLLEAREKLKTYGQEHVLKYYEELNEEEKQTLIDQIAATDMSILEACRHREELTRKGEITPIATMQLPEIQAHAEEYRRIGIQAIREGKLGAVLLAGGMGTRLGSDAPKGMYNVGINRELYIFQCLVKHDGCGQGSRQLVSFVRDEQ